MAVVGDSRKGGRPIDLAEARRRREQASSEPDGTANGSESRESSTSSRPGGDRLAGWRFSDVVADDILQRHPEATKVVDEPADADEILRALEQTPYVPAPRVPKGTPPGEHAQPPLSDAIDRASELVKAGLVNARQAVGALRGDAQPTVAELPSLIASYKADMNLDVTLRIEGEARTLPADPSLALYRGAEEALTNVARCAPSACTTVTVRYERDRTKLSVDNGVSATPPTGEWVAAADWRACVSGLSGLAARCRPARRPKVGVSR